MSDPTDILNWQRIDATVTTSGQPSEDQLAAIRDMGVTHVINLGLHTHQRALRDEAATVAALGMTYTYIPVAFDAPTEGDYRAFCTALDDADGPVHVHCIVNARVSAFVYRHRRERLGWDEARARREMERVWQPGGVWARFIGDEAAVSSEHRFAGRDYERQRQRDGP